MSERIYKVYDPDGNALIFNSLTKLRQAFDLTADEVRRVFLPGVHTVADGVEVITY